MNAYFATEREGCPIAAAGKARRDAEFKMFQHYAKPMPPGTLLAALKMHRGGFA